MQYNHSHNISIVLGVTSNLEMILEIHRNKEAINEETDMFNLI